MPWCTKLVKFVDGQYGIRRGFLGFYIYKDFDSYNHWWTKWNRYYLTDCRTTDGNARRVFNDMYGMNEEGLRRKQLKRDKGTPIDQSPQRSNDGNL